MSGREYVYLTTSLCGVFLFFQMVCGGSGSEKVDYHFAYLHIFFKKVPVDIRIHLNSSDENSK